MALEISPYLSFNGQCREAFRFYERCLSGKISDIHTYGESPMKDDVPPDWQERVMHVRLIVGDFAVMGSDAPPPHFAPPQGISVSIVLPDPAEAERIFNELAEGGKVAMPFQKTFWSPGFGMTTDRFGIPWMVNVEHKT